MSIPKVDYISYIKEVKNQRLAEPKYPKLDDNIPTVLPEYIMGKVVSQILTDNYIYTGILSSKETLFNSENNTFTLDQVIFNDILIVEDKQPQHSTTKKKLYYEFIKPKPRRYLYLPVTKIIRDLLKNKLPQINKWDVSGSVPKTVIEKPEGLNIRLLRDEDWSREINTGTTNIEHPFLPYMKFTGRATEHSDSTVLYEYYDTTGYYGPINQKYSSNLRPYGLSFPLGVVLQEYLYTDDCLQQHVGQYPTYEYFEDDLPKYGQFLGYITNSSYSSKTYYLYQEDNYNTFLSEVPPNERANSYINNIHIYIGYQFQPLFFPSLNSEQRVLIKQKAVPSSLLIKDETIQLDFSEIIGDYVLFNQEYYLEPCDGQVYNMNSLFNTCSILNDSWNN